jgi:hypothetical protein
LAEAAAFVSASQCCRKRDACTEPAKISMPAVASNRRHWAALREAYCRRHSLHAASGLQRAGGAAKGQRADHCPCRQRRTTREADMASCACRSRYGLVRRRSSSARYRRRMHHRGLPTAMSLHVVIQSYVHRRRAPPNVEALCGLSPLNRTYTHNCCATIHNTENPRATSICVQ